MNTSHPLDRRTFLVQSALTIGAGLTAPRFLRARDTHNRLNIAIIGAGGRGAANTAGVASENIVALCDVNQTSLGRAAMRYPKARQEVDFRKLFDHSKEFDAVVVSTCEHTHAFATLAALRLNKHVYCEKPLTHNVFEARIIREAAAKTKVATQMGTQMHATDNFRRVVELIQTGAVGPVKEVHVWVSRAWGLQSEAEAKKNKDIVYVAARPTEAVKVPDDLEWDLWLGPAPERPFHTVYVPGPKWYRWWDFGNGTMSDLGSHWNDMAFWALDLRVPTSVEASGPKPHPEIAPASMQVTWEFPAREKLPAVRMHWYQGTNKPALWSDGKIPKWGDGVLFVGERGMLLANYSKHVLLPEKEFADFTRPAPYIPKSLGHYAEWIDACKTGKLTTCNFEYAGWLTEANHLGNVAFRVGRKLLWDAAALKAKGCPEADAFIRREYRKGWKLV
jgi:predicted dehydrogenase